MNIDKDRLMKYFQERINYMNDIMERFPNESVAKPDAQSRQEELINLRRIVDFNEFTIFEEDEDESKSLNESEYKESLTKQFKLLQRAGEVTVGTDNVRALPQMTEAMIQIGNALGLQRSAFK